MPKSLEFTQAVYKAASGIIIGFILFEVIAFLSFIQGCNSGGFT